MMRLSPLQSSRSFLLAALMMCCLIASFGLFHTLSMAQENDTTPTPAASSGSLPPRDKANGDIYFKTVHIIPHSHWDVGWLKTKKEYYEQDVKTIIGAVMKALNENLGRKFIFVEMSFISYWWEDSSVSKEEKKLFTKFLNEKRIEFALAGMTMSDEAANTYTSVIHTLTRGHQYVIDTFNSNGHNFIPSSSFRIDPFGSTTTMTRLYRESGLTDTVIMRIPQGNQTEMRNKKQMSFYWNLSDGSSVYSNIMDYQYCVRPLFFDGESSFVYGTEKSAGEEMHDQILKYSLGFNQSDIMLPGGCDFSFESAPERFAKIERGMKYINDNPDYFGYKVKFSLLSEYLEASRPKAESVFSYNADFMPYADGPTAFWTGYYTSYPILKQSIRTAEGFYRAAKALFAISAPYVKDDLRKGFIEQGFKQLDVLAVAMADVTHHDAVTGTSKIEVTKDYIESLSDGVKQAKQALTLSLTSLITSKISQSDIILEDYLNKLVSSSFSFTELMQKFSSLISERKLSYSIPIVIFNSLSWDIENHVETIGPDEAAPFSSIIKQICFFSMEGTRLKSQYAKSVLAPDEYDLHFLVPKVPALGYTTVLIKPCDNFEPGSINEELVTVEDKPYTISNSKTSVTFCKKNNAVTLCSIEKEGTKYDITQKLMAYTGISGYTFGVSQQKSGAYIFAPKNQEPSLINPTSNVLLVSNSISNNIFTQVEQTVEKYVKQVVRLYQPEIAQKQGFDLEYIYYFDDIPSDNEIITKFDASAFISSKGVFYCDKNGLETVRSNTKSKVEATYLPIVYNCFIRDEEKKTQLTLFVSETHGAASMKNGELEIMLHRRTLSDDGRGVDQPVNDESNVAINIKVRIDSSSPEPNLRGIAYPKVALTTNFPPFVAPFQKSFYTPPTGNVVETFSMRNLVTSFSILEKPLPPSVHISNIDIVLNRKTPSASDVKALLQLQSLETGSENSQFSLTDSFKKEFIDKKIHLMNETNLSTSKNRGPISTNTKIAVSPFSFRTFMLRQGRHAQKLIFKEQDQALEWTFTVGLMIGCIAMIALLATLVVYFIYNQAKYAYSMLEK